MRHRKHTFKIGRSSAHRRAMMGNMISSLVEFGQIETTVTKAKEARRFADKMITYAKKGDLHHRRLAVAKLRNKDAVKKLFDELAPQFADRKGGYTRIIRLDGKRQGDAADLCILQWTLEAPAAKAKAPKKAAKKSEEADAKADEAPKAEKKPAKKSAAKKKAAAKESEAKA